MDIGKVKPVSITEELSKSYVDYAMSVIVSRALPDIRDGLKPVHRRILYAMNQMSLTPGKSFSKSAKVVGEVLGKYHPHSDTSVYDALVRLAQDFSMRYPLIEGQGNFGSVDGDSPAAMRYTEARMSKLAPLMLIDIDKNTVGLTDNFDSTLKEPVYLPASIPNLLLMGSEGIAVGMATKIPPHNLKEVIDAVIHTVKRGTVTKDNKKYNSNVEKIIGRIEGIASGGEVEVSEKLLKAESLGYESKTTVEELIQIIPGPDFPTAGVIYDGNSLKEVYETGRGKIIIRGVAEIVEGKRGKQKIIITELPYQVNKAHLVAKIALLVKEKKLKGISDLRDESDKDGMRVVVELKRDGRPKSVLNRLYKFTKLQNSFSANFVALVDGTPYQVNLKQILVEYIKHRQLVVFRRTIFELTSAMRRSHTLEGLQIALDNLDDVIETIKKSRTQENAKSNLIRKFKLTEIQATAILDMQLRRLAALERLKIEKEYKEIQKKIKKLIAILRDPKKAIRIVVNELTQIQEKFKDTRRTKIYKQKLGEISEEDLVAKEDTLITITKTGYIKRVPRGTYRSQRRGGKGVVGMTTKNEDEIDQIYSATTHDDLFFFTNKGKVYGTKVWEIPASARQSKGQALVNFLNLETGEKVLSMLAMGTDSQIKYLFMATRKGVVKKSKISDFQNLRSSGLIAMRLKPGDEIVAIKPTAGKDDVLMITKHGKAIRFPEGNVRPMGRATTGMTGIKIDEGDHVITLEVFSQKPPKSTDGRRKVFRDIVVITENGLGKRTGVHLFPSQRRAGKGVKASVVNNKTGKLAGAIMINQKADMLIITSKKGQVIKLPVKNIPQMGRITQGVIMMRFNKKGDCVQSVATLEKSSITQPDKKSSKSSK
ncbi:DNA gyrase subunit A [Patescibacteria group bacterium]